MAQYTHIQPQFNTYLQGQYAGLPGENSQNAIFAEGYVAVSTAEATAGSVRPGEGVLWDNTAMRWRLARTVAEEPLVTGVLVLLQAVVANNATPAANNNLGNAVTFSNGDHVHVMTSGVITVRAGGDIAYDQKVRYRSIAHPTPAERNLWTSQTISTSTSNIERSPCFCMTQGGVSAGDLVNIAIGTGRVR